VNRPVFTGLTWSHPRGRAPLTRLAALADQPGPLHVPHSRVRWQTQDLAGFESRPIWELADWCDLIVLDHPGLGAAVASGALLPLDEVIDATELDGWRNGAIAGCYPSYHYAGHQWAAPIDAAAQVCAYRPDLLPQPPRDWDEALGLDAALAVAIPTGGPHTLLTFLGIAAAHDPWFRPGPRHLVPPEIATSAYSLLGQAVQRTPPALRDLDPIQLLDGMRLGALACVPLVFGYVTYSAAGGGVRFTDAPGLSPTGPPGSVLGGTGLAVAARHRDEPRVLDHLRQAMHPLAQARVIPEAGGQPAASAAWTDPVINAACSDFYTSTVRSLHHAWRRPRRPGWITVQTQGSAILRDGLLRDRPAADTLADLNACYHTHLHPGEDS
jgi:multiple sugar transport system substrate-binding protein